MQAIDIDKKVSPKTKKIRIKKVKSSPKQGKTKRIRVVLKNPSKIELKRSPQGKLQTRMNEDLIKLMEQLHTLMQKKGEPFKARAYKKAQETIMSFTEDITSIDQLKGKPGIGETILEKLKEFSETGTLRLLEREKENPENLLSDIYGVGPKKAKDLVEKGITTIAQLRSRQDELLNEVQKAGLLYYEDILERIPRSEIDEYHALFETAFGSVKQEGSKYEIVGSYRRGSQFSGDIDVIITAKTEGVFKAFINRLLEQQVILVVLSRGPSKCLVIAKLPGSAHARRVDFLYTTPEEYPFSVLYFTGSKAFNTVMRGYALKKGYSLNEHGLHKMIEKKKEEKVDHVFTNEKDIFDFLGLAYREPVERVDGRAVLGEPMVPPKAPSLREEIVEGKMRGEIVKGDLQLDGPVREPALDPVLVLKKEKVVKPKAEPKTRKVKGEKAVAKGEKPAELVENPFLQFKQDGLSFLEPLKQTDLETMVLKANVAYYNKTPLLTDNEYDIVKEYLERKYPDSQVLLEIGAPIQKNKATLPYQMPSMDKIKPDTNALSTWKSIYTGPYVLSCKLDGVSGLYTTMGDTPKLYTRGNGTIGQDISHLLKYLKLPTEQKIVVRGEFIIPKAVFEEKYKSDFANPRNLVAGIINSKTVDEKIRDLHFVTYEVMEPVLKPSEQLYILGRLKFEVVQHQVVQEISNEALSALLLDWRSHHQYEIDGVIVTNDKIYARTAGNPDHAFAFKMVISDQVAEVKVVDVIWTPSKNGYLKPRVRVEPVRLSGVTIEYATGFNGKFIEENKIGVGALIEIIRSGDVIPYIKSVIVPAERAKMPAVSYVWTDTHVDIILENVAEDVVVLEKNITAFFVGIEVEGLSTGNVKRLIAAGFDSVAKIIHMKKLDYENVEGFKSKLTDKIYTSIHDRLGKASLIEIMAASNVLGRGLGERKIKPIMDAFPIILTSNETNSEKVAKLLTVKGIGKENAATFVSNIPAFLAFMQECGLEHRMRGSPVPEQENVLRPVNISHPLYGKKVVMTKVRDKQIIEHLKQVGAILEDGIKKDTFVLIVKSKEDVSNKTKFAVEHAIPIMTPEEFKGTYNIV